MGEGQNNRMWICRELRLTKPPKSRRWRLYHVFGKQQNSMKEKEVKEE